MGFGAVMVVRLKGSLRHLVLPFTLPGEVEPSPGHTKTSGRKALKSQYSRLGRRLSKRRPANAVHVRMAQGAHRPPSDTRPSA
jgi:hypothetical protein